MQHIRKLSVSAAPVVILRETLLDYLVISWYLPAANNCLFNQPLPCFLLDVIVDNGDVAVINLLSGGREVLLI